MNSESRKIQGKQWYITLPQDWRDQHKLTRGDSLTISYGDHSVFVANPENRHLTILETELIKLLVTLPSMNEGTEITKSLKYILDTLDGKL